MQFTTEQTDALTELVNIGYGRAANALSELTGYRVMLELPSLAIYEIPDIARRLTRELGDEVACVNQVFSGPISGNAMLLLDQRAAVGLSALLDDNAAPALDASSREVLQEAGNVLLNACLGVFGNLLRVQVAFSVPNMQVEAVPALLESFSFGGEELSHGLLIQTKFRLRASEVSGFLVIVLGFASLERVLAAVERWER